MNLRQVDRLILLLCLLILAGVLLLVKMIL